MEPEPLSPDKTAVSVGNLAEIRPLLPSAGSPRGLVAGPQKNCETELSPVSFWGTEHGLFGPCAMAGTNNLEDAAAQSLGHKTG